jgi:integrase
MAHVDRDPTRAKTPYVVRWRDETGRQRKRGFARKVDADRYRAEVEHSLNVGSYIDPQLGRQTVRDYAERWRTAQPHRPNTAMRVRSQLEHHVYPALGDRPIAAVRPSEIQAFVSGVQLAPGSVRTLVATLSAVFGAAVRDRLIGHDPTEGVKRPTVPRERIVPLTVEHVQSIVDALPDRYRAAAVVAAGAGLRQGEVFGLQVADVDFLRRVIRIERQVQPTGVGPLKNRAAYRSVPVGQVVIDALALHLAEYPAAGSTYVFRMPKGQPVHRGVFGPLWRRVRTAAAMPTVDFHDLRHFYASALIRAGLSVKVLSERLGHSNAAMTLNVYSHLWPDDEDRTRQAIDDVFRRDVPTVRPKTGS